MAKGPQISLDTIKNDPTIRKQVEGFVAELVDALTKTNLQKETVKDLKNEAKTSLGISPGILMKLVREKMDPGYIEAETNALVEVKEIADAIENSVKP